jgi:hypothetical protein
MGKKSYISYTDSNGVDKRRILTIGDLEKLGERVPPQEWKKYGYKQSNLTLRAVIDQASLDKRADLKERAKKIQFNPRCLEQLNLAWDQATKRKRHMSFESIFNFVWEFIKALETIGEQLKQLTLDKLTELWRLHTVPAMA